MNKIKNYKKVFSLMLSFLMVLGVAIPNVMEVNAADYTVTSYQNINGRYAQLTINGDIDSVCAEPTNQRIPAVGDTISLSGANDITRKIAWIQTKGARASSLDYKTKYLLHHAVAQVIGYGAAHDYPAEVRQLISDAQNYSGNLPEGFDVWIGTFPNGSQAQVAWKYNPPPPEGYVTLKKTVAENKHLTDLCPENYSLAGAEYRVSTGSDGSGYVGSLVTDANGDTNTLTLNAGTYYVKEAVAPKGYNLDPKTYTVNVTSGGTATVSSADKPKFDPLSLKVMKKGEDGADKNLPLEGAEYTVKYYKEFLDENTVVGKTPFRTWVFRTDKKGEFRLFDEWKVGGDELFKDDKDRVVGVYGTYTFEETKAPLGFALTEGLISIQQVKAGATYDDITVLKDVTDIEKTQKVNIGVKKVDAETGENKPQGYGSLAGAVYEVYFFDPLAAGDILVGTITTDEKGEGKLEGLKAGLYKVKETVASAGYLLEGVTHNIEARIKEINTAFFEYFADSKEKPTNVEILKTSLGEKGVKVTLEGAELELQKEDGTVLESFTSTKEAKTFKALPIGKYKIHEVKAPEGYFPLEEDFVFEVKAVEEVQSFEVFNEPTPEIKTKALFENGVDNAIPDKANKVIDTITYDKVLSGHPYTFKGELIDLETGKTVATGKTDFTPEEANGEVKVDFTFDGTEFKEGAKLVVTETLYRNDKKTADKKVAEHIDRADLEQTVSIPKIGTTATDKVDGDKDLFAGEKQVIVDKVEYKKLTIGKEYTVKGILMDKETGKPILDDGKEVTAEKTFTAETEDGYAELEFTFNATALEGKTIVAFEDVYKDKIKVATHTDIEDKDQTIYIPKIGTTATSKDDLTKSVLPIKSVTITDKIAYSNLIIGKIYNVKGQLVSKETGKVITEAEGSFMAEKTEGDVELDFTFDADKMAGSDVVVFESMYSYNPDTDTEKIVAEHKDIEDVGQTVHIEKPEVKTTATIDNGKKKATASSEMTIIDKVEYKNLVIGREYTVKGILMDKKTGKPFMVDGKEITAEKKFTATTKEGYVDLAFKFNGKGLQRTEIVVFEKMYYGKEEIGSHQDLNDVGQTVEIVPPAKVNTGDTADLAGYVMFSIISMLLLALGLIKGMNKLI